IPHKANLHCSSVPTGDHSLSYMHQLPRRKPRDQSLEQMARDSSDHLEDMVQRPSRITREDSFLLALVRREFKSQPFSSSLLDKLQKELETLDPISSGFLHQSQLSRLFLRHQVPLQLPTVKLLCQRFSRKSSPEMVNYGKLLWFLKGATSTGLQQNETAVDSNFRKTPSYSEHRQSAPPQGSSSQMCSKLRPKGHLTQEATGHSLTPSSLLLEKFGKSQVGAICGKHGLYLTLSLLETLLNHQDLGYQGEIKWQNFVKWLDRASSHLLSELPTGKNGKRAPEKLEVPESSQGKTEHVKTPEENPWPENCAALTSAPQDPVNSLKVRPVSQPYESPAVIKEPEQHEMWIDRFRKLENALYLCDLNNTGVLEKERARRLIQNYNLMYSLSLSPRKIDQALRKFRSGENLLLEPALRYLKEL
ncbi:uncharacterized protein C1orf87 homolog, partial [Nannospalax galili]|uniref:uncharacterized protein C1orf87 homolog n=1 Tax=Nannospalax galili TaxID=1026970 RepID=UPI00111BF9FF